ncbi:MAG: DUF4215 domain-containing protein [Deltaproteobacteria bacterium]|nr:DUF4215 domain-containing protein [Deltaproteobacteria bacterium]
MKNLLWKKYMLKLAISLSLVLWSSLSLAATFTVNSFEDIDDENTADEECAIAGTGACTLRAAISQANVLGGSHTIVLQEGTYLITGAMGDDTNHEGDLDITNHMTLQGQGARKTILKRVGNGRVVHIFLGSKVILQDLTIRDGNLPEDIGHGAGIYNQEGDLSLYRCHVLNNTNQETNGIYNGGGVYSGYGDLTIEQSTIANNKSMSSGGGIFMLEGNFQLHNSTISNNFANDNGGGMLIGTPIESLVSYSTILLNKGEGQGGGVYVGLPVSFKGNIIALNQYKNDPFDPQADCVFDLVLEGHNLIGVDCFLENFESTDQIGTSDSPIDPLIGPLQDNGGPTDTHALLAGSRALSNGDPENCPEFDQRGFARAEGDGCDIGAFQTICGDGVKSGNEECDDGNKVDGDGCDALCKVEASTTGDGDGESSGGCELSSSMQKNNRYFLIAIAGFFGIFFSLRSLAKKKGFNL